MAIIKEIKEMDKMEINYLEVYTNHITGYKQYKEEKQKAEHRITNADITAAQ